MISIDTNIAKVRGNWKRILLLVFAVLRLSVVPALAAECTASHALACAIGRAINRADIYGHVAAILVRPLDTSSCISMNPEQSNRLCSEQTL